MSKFTIGFINHDNSLFEKHLGPSIEKFNKEDFDLISTTSEFFPARNYNEIIKSSKNDYIILVHEDMELPQNFLECVNSTISFFPDFGALGLIGFDDFSNTNRRTLISETGYAHKIDFFDSCLLVIKKSNNIYFDESTFNEYHLYVEDYCMQARERNLFNYTILIDYLQTLHVGHTYAQHNNMMWGKYNQYYDIFLKKWTKKLNRTLFTWTKDSFVLI